MNLQHFQKLFRLVDSGGPERPFFKVLGSVTNSLERRFPFLLRSTPDFECPCCGATGHFASFGNRRFAQCQQCLSLERHRLEVLTLRRLNQELKVSRPLVVAPHKSTLSWLSSCGIQSVRTDLAIGSYEGKYPELDLISDIRRLPFADQSFDLVVCSHVLEHVKEDQCAIERLFRVLRHGGVALLTVPISMDRTTVEFDSDGRHGEFHVRVPGRDYFSRYEKAGFSVELHRSEQFDLKYQPFRVYRHPRRVSRSNEIEGRKVYTVSEVVPVCRKS